MGVSTNASIAFGFDIGEDDDEGILRTLWGEREEDADVEYEDGDENGAFSIERFEEWIGEQSGLMRPPSEWSIRTFGPYNEALQKIVDAYPIEIIEHQSMSAPAYIIALRGTEITATRGNPEEVYTRHVMPEEVAVLKKFCEDTKLCWYEPRWLLFSYWGQ